MRNLMLANNQLISISPTTLKSIDDSLDTATTIVYEICFDEYSKIISVLSNKKIFIFKLDKDLLNHFEFSKKSLLKSFEFSNKTQTLLSQIKHPKEVLLFIYKHEEESFHQCCRLLYHFVFTLRNRVLLQNFNYLLGIKIRNNYRIFFAINFEWNAKH